MNWPMFTRVERRAVRMNSMMERLAVDAIKLVRMRQGQTYLEARAKCLICPYADECLQWLDNTPQESAKPEFCPNLKLLESCQRRDS